MKAHRSATAVWEGDLSTGNGSVRLDTAALPEFLVTWASRTQNPNQRTSPEELIAAAQAACYVMALSATLEKNELTPVQLEARAECTLEQVEGAFKITRMVLRVRGQVPDVSEERFQEIAREAEKGCPVSNALRESVAIELDAGLQS